MRDLVEHCIKEHVDSCIRFDQLLEFLEHRVQFLGILFDTIDNTAEPFLVDTMIRWQPVTNSVSGCFCQSTGMDN